MWYFNAHFCRVSCLFGIDFWVAFLTIEFRVFLFVCQQLVTQLYIISLPCGACTIQRVYIIKWAHCGSFAKHRSSQINEPIISIRCWGPHAACYFCWTQSNMIVDYQIRVTLFQILVWDIFLNMDLGIRLICLFSQMEISHKAIPH